jgi:hypothetical protein
LIKRDKKGKRKEERGKRKEQRAKLRLSHRQRLLADYVMAEQLKDRAAGLKSKD